MPTSQRAIIVANSNKSIQSDVNTLLGPDDLLIAADGGGRHCLDAGCVPKMLIGDLDSISLSELNELISLGTKVLKHPVKKNETDLELAIAFAINNGVEEVIILSALGGRWDHTLGNITLLASNRFRTARIRIIDHNQEIDLIRAGDTHIIHGKPEDTVSLIPICDTVVGVTTSGLEYILDGNTLVFGTTLSLSNALTSKQATITIKEGLLICIVIRSNE
jgi:thiamine pyrophosphokinase